MSKTLARPRGSVADPVCATFRMERAARKDLQALATAAGMSASALIEELIARVDRDANGAPVWAQNRSTDEELPIERLAS